jgi:hypothetical protein
MLEELNEELTDLEEDLIIGDYEIVAGNKRKGKQRKKGGHGFV